VKPLEFAAAKKTADHETRHTLARVYQHFVRREFAEVERLKSGQLQKDRARTPKP
jgi:hypothetical protein